MTTMWLCILSFNIGMATMLTIDRLLERRRQVRPPKPPKLHNCDRDGHKYGPYERVAITVINRSQSHPGVSALKRVCDVCKFEELEEM